MIVVAILFYITSRTMHKFILHHPQIKNISDFAYYASGKKTYAREFAGVMLVANNVMLIGFHVSTGSMVLNTLSGHPTCTVVFSVTMMIIGTSLKRTMLVLLDQITNVAIAKPLPCVYKGLRSLLCLSQVRDISKASPGLKRC